MAGEMFVPTLLLEDGNWQCQNVDVLNVSSMPKICYMFMERDKYPRLETTPNLTSRETQRELILKPYNVPRIMLSDTCTNSNGYFGSRSTYGDQNTPDSLGSHNTWFRCLAKFVHKPGEAGLIKNEYTWFEMGIFTHWDHTGQCRVLCIDTPTDFKSALFEIVSRSTLEPNDPFAMLEPLIDEIVKLCDQSVGRVRDAIRALEKQRLRTSPDFQEMQEISRHAIHAREAVTLVIDILENLHKDQKQVYERTRTRLERWQWEQTQSHLQFQLQIVKSLKERSISNFERLNTEVTFWLVDKTQAYNVIIQKDSLVMKSIAFLTMIFLPGTFISAYFSTTFFSYNDGGWGGMSNVWVYWVVTIPSTMATILFFQAWVNMSYPGSARPGIQRMFSKKNSSWRFDDIAPPV